MQAIKLVSLIILAFCPTIVRVINGQQPGLAPTAANSVANQRPQQQLQALPNGAPLGQQHQQHQQPNTQSLQQQQQQLSSLELLHKSHQQLTQLLNAGRNSPIVAQAANLTISGTRYANNVFDLIKDVGRGVLASVPATTTTNQAQSQYQLVAAAPLAGGPPIAAQPAISSSRQAGGNNETGSGDLSGDTLVATNSQHLSISPSGPVNSQSEAQASKYREQGELLRQEIVSRVGQLQQVLANSMGAVKNNGDLIMRRLFEMVNRRLNDARTKADRVISEPTNNELAVRALSTVNNGLRNLNSVIASLVARLEAASAANAANGVQPTPLFGNAQNSTAIQLLDPSKLQANIAQLKQQFSSALGAFQQQQQQQQQQSLSKPTQSIEQQQTVAATGPNVTVRQPLQAGPQVPIGGNVSAPKA